MHPAGVEPATLGSEDRCSVQLSYGCSRPYRSDAETEVYLWQPWVPMRMDVLDAAGSGDQFGCLAGGRYFTPPAFLKAFNPSSQVSSGIVL